MRVGSKPKSPFRRVFCVRTFHAGGRAQDIFADHRQSANGPTTQDGPLWTGACRDRGQNGKQSVEEWNQAAAWAVHNKAANGSGGRCTELGGVGAAAKHGVLLHTQPRRHPGPRGRPLRGACPDRRIECRHLPISHQPSCAPRVINQLGREVWVSPTPSGKQRQPPSGPPRRAPKPARPLA